MSTKKRLPRMREASSFSKICTYVPMPRSHKMMMIVNGTPNSQPRMSGMSCLLMMKSSLNSLLAGT